MVSEYFLFERCNILQDVTLKDDEGNPVLDGIGSPRMDSDPDVEIFHEDLPCRLDSNRYRSVHNLGEDPGMAIEAEFRATVYTDPLGFIGEGVDRKEKIPSSNMRICMLNTGKTYNIVAEPNVIRESGAIRHLEIQIDTRQNQ